MKNFAEINRASTGAKKNFNLIEWLQTDSHGKQSATRVHHGTKSRELAGNPRPLRYLCATLALPLRYAAMIFAVLVMSIGQMWGTDIAMELDQIRVLPTRSALVSISNGSNTTTGSGKLKVGKGTTGTFTFTATVSGTYKIKSITFALNNTPDAFSCTAGGSLSGSGTSWSFTPTNSTPTGTASFSLTAPSGKDIQITPTVTMTTGETVTIEELKTFTYSEPNFSFVSTAATSQVTITNKANANASSNYINLSKSNNERSITIAAKSGYNLKFISFYYYDAASAPSVTPSTTTYTASTYTWVPSSTTTSVDFTFDASGAGIKIWKIYVGYEAAASCTAPNHVDISGTWGRFGGEDISLTAAAYSSAGTGSPIADANITGWQWQKLIGSTWTNVSNGTSAGVTTSGATTKNLQISNCGQGNSGKYRCVVSTGATCSTPSATATDGSEGFGVKVYTLECYTDGTTVYNFTRDGNNERGSVEVDLAARAAGHEFKIHADNYYGVSSTIYEDEDDWVFTTSGNNVNIRPGLGGTFTFTIDYSTNGDQPVLEVMYPRKTVYLVPNSDWKTNSAKFAFYYWRDGGSGGWTDFLSTSVCDGDVYPATIPQWDGIQIIGVRFDPSKVSTGNWDDKWNQTQDLTLSSNDKVAISDWNSATYNSNYAAPTYTISFAGNGSSSGSMSDIEDIACDADKAVTANSYTKTGYSFAGWKANVDVKINGSTVSAGTVINDKVTIQNIRSNITLTAQWSVNSYNLTWNLGGGTTTSAGTGISSGVSANTTSSVAYGASLTAPTVTKANYDFSAWSPSVAKTMPAAATTYTATWTAKKYNVSTSLTHVTVSSGTTGSNAATYGTNYSVSFAADGGYIFPSDITVTIGGVTKTKGTEYTWDSSTGVVTITGSYITGNIVITVTAEEMTTCYEFEPGYTSGSLADYDVVATSDGGIMEFAPLGSGSTLTYTSTGLQLGSSSNCAVSVALENNMKAGTVITAKLYMTGSKNDRTVYLRDGSTSTNRATWSFTADGEDHTYTYIVAADDGLIGTNVFRIVRKNDVMIKSLKVSNCGSSATTYNMTHTLSHVTKSSGATGDGSIYAGANYTAVFTDDTGYDLPSTITVTIGGESATANTDYYWTQATGKLVIPGAKVTGNIAVTITGVAECTPHGLAYATGSVTKTLCDGKFTNTLTNGNSLSVSYSSSKTGVATVDSDGEVTLVGAGTTTIKATFAGDATYCAGNASYTLTVSESTAAGLAYGTSTVKKDVGDDAFTNTLTNTHSLTVTYTSSDESVATVASNGAVTIKAAGTTTITANSAQQMVSSTCYAAGSATYTLTVYPVYTVSYNAMGGTCSPTSTNTTTALGEVTLPTPTHASYSFDGWYTTAGVKAGNAGAKYSPSGNITLYAKWTGSCAGGSSTTISIFDGAVDTQNSTASDRYDKDHKDYYTNATTGFQYKTLGIKDELIDVSTPTSYTDRGSYIKAVRMNGSGASNYIELKMPTGYTAELFVAYSGYSSTNQKFGVHTSSGTTPNGSNCDTWNASISDGTTVCTATIDLSANTTYYLSGGGSSCLFEEVKVTLTPAGATPCYTVTYDGNGATSGYTNDPAQYEENDDPEVLDCGYEKTDYAFIGWAEGTTHRDAGTVDYQPDDVITDISENKTLYAIWKAIKYFVTEGNWNTSANWSPTGVPTIEDPVVIQANVTVDINNAKALFVDIEAGNTLTIGAGKALIIEKTLTKAGGATAAADVIINSTRVAGTGALVIGRETGSNQATVNFQTKVKRDDGAWINQFIGSPFSDLEPYVDYALQIYKFMPAGGGNKGFWHKLSSGNEMEAFWGYNVLYNDNEFLDVTWTGTLNASSNNVTKTGSNAVQTDNLFANSWVAPIHIAEFEEDDFTNFDPTIYIFNAGTPQQEGSMSSTGTATDPGTYVTIPINSGEWLTGTLSVIPAMQAFFVKATGASPTLKFDYSKLVYDPAVDDEVGVVPTRAPKRATASEAPEVIRLRVTGENGWAETTYLLGREDFTEGFDNGWDGRYMEGEDTNPQLYAPTSDGNMAVNCVPQIEGTLLGFRKGNADSQYTFTFEYAGDEDYYLKDLKLDIETPIDGEHSYAFTAEAGDNVARFIIVRKTPTITTGTADVESDVSGARKVIYNNKVYIIRGGSIYSVDGQVIK